MSTQSRPPIILSKQQKEIYKKLVNKGIPYIKAWLEEIKASAGSASTQNVKGPFNSATLKTNAANGQYNIILQWCVENIPDYDYTGIPIPSGVIFPTNSGKSDSGAAKSNSVAAKSDSAAAKSDTDEVSILENWLKDPTKDEYGKDIVISLSVNSKYSILYTASFKYLYELNNPDNKPLTIDIYKKIQDRLPKYHVYNFVINDSVTDTSANGASRATGASSVTYNYDHLIMRNLASCKISEDKVDDTFFNTEYDIFEEIYIQVEKLLKKTQYKYQSIQALIKLIDINDIIYEYNYRILEYIARIRLFDKNKLAIKATGFNLQLTYKNIDLDKIKIKLYFEIYDSAYYDLVDYHYGRFNSRPHDWNSISEGHIRDVRGLVFYKNEQNAIIKFMKTAIFDIAELYEESKINVDEYLPISEDQKVSPPLYPSPPVLRNVIMKYIMLKNRIKRTQSEIEESTGKKRTDLEDELKEYNEKMGSLYIIEACEAEILAYENKKKLYTTAVQKYEKDLNKYKKDVLGKRSPYLKKSYSPKRVLPFTPVEKREYKSLSLPKKSNSSEKFKCVNDSDPLTQEAFDDMSQKKLDNLAKITTTITTSDNKKKKIITCYDTVALYNYILECYNKQVPAYNIAMGRDIEITPDDKNQVKKKIRAFTSNNTLPPIIIDDAKSGNNKKVFGRLIDLYIIPYNINRNAIVTGFHAIKLRIKIGGIDFLIFEETFLKIPMLYGDSDRENDGEIPMITNIYDELLKKKKSGNLFTTNYYPYRRNTEYILRSPDTSDMFFDDDEEELIAARERFYRDLTLL
jgi:hypothetical protein